MPHVIVEYSANLAAAVEIKSLLAALHEAALETGVFPAGGIRTRAERRDEYIGLLVNAHLARVSSRFRIADKFELDVAWQLQLALVSDPVLAGGLSSTVGGTSSGAQRRLVELAGVLGQGSAWSVSHNLDRLAVKIALPFGDLTVGRQVLSWGTGRLRPTLSQPLRAIRRSSQVLITSSVIRSSP